MNNQQRKTLGGIIQKSKYNPNLPALFVIVFLICFIIATFEISLTIVEGSKVFRKSTIEVRTIRLKEHIPRTQFVVEPDTYYLQTTDSLEKKMYLFAMDEHGFIKPSGEHEDPDLKLFFLGGSTTECMFVNDRHRFPYLAGRIIEEKTGLKVNSYNSGVSGNHSLHSINLLINKILAFEPDVVCLLHNVNDLNIMLYEGDYWNSNRTRSMIELIDIKISDGAPTLLRRCKDIVRSMIPHLYRRISIAKKKWQSRHKNRIGDIEFDEFAHLRGMNIQFDSDRLVSKFTANLKMFIGIVRAAGAVPVLITQANRFTPNPDPLIKENMKDLEDMGIDYETYIEIYSSFNQAIRDVGEKQNVPVIDLDREIPKESLYMYDTMHFNGRGSDLAATIITDFLLEQRDIIKHDK